MDNKYLSLIIFASLVLILSSSQANAQDSLQLEIEILDNGFVIIKGNSNIDPGLNEIYFSDGKISGKTQALTSKNKDTWQFSLNINRIYSSSSIKIIFPENTVSISDITTNLHNNINLNRKISIDFIDSNKPIDIDIEYSLRDRFNISSLIYALLILIALTTAFFVLAKKKNINKISIIFPTLNDKEKEIIKIAMKGPIRQKELRKLLNMPKASFSRYIHNLEKKRIIQREGFGKNKVIRIK